MPTALLILAMFVALMCIVVATNPADERIVGLALFLGILGLRPALIGEIVGPVGVVLMAAVLIFSFRSDLNRLGRTPGAQHVALIFVVGYGVAFNALSPAAAAVMPIVAAAGWIAGHRPRVLGVLCGLSAILALQQATALVLTEWLGLRTWAVVAGGDRGGTNYTVSVLGSITSGSGGVFTAIDERLTGPFGEPGVFAAFLAISAAVDLGYHGRWRIGLHLPVIAAIALTQSVAGAATYFASCSVVIIHRMTLRRTTTHRKLRVRDVAVISALVIGCLWMVTRSDSDVLSVKRDANAVSVMDRLDGVDVPGLLISWSSAPFGAERDTDLGGINLLQTSVTYGPLLLIFGGWLYLSPLWGADSRRAAPVVAALLFTVTFSQPPFLYLWIFFAFVASGVAGRKLQSGVKSSMPANARVR